MLLAASRAIGPSESSAVIRAREDKCNIVTGILRQLTGVLDCPTEGHFDQSGPVILSGVTL
jgi:hypothetical protein